LERYELTHAQFVLLASAHWLSLQKKDVTQILLSNHTQIDPMTTSTVLRTLQTKGFIIRTEHKTDTRAKTVELTDVGLKNIKQAIVVVENFDRQFFGMLDGKAHDFNSELIALLGNKNNI
jgi:DNA-binding MarR family transcriptional regulator